MCHRSVRRVKRARMMATLRRAATIAKAIRLDRRSGECVKATPKDRPAHEADDGDERGNGRREMALTKGISRNGRIAAHEREERLIGEKAVGVDIPGDHGKKLDEAEPLAD